MTEKYLLLTHTLIVGDLGSILAVLPAVSVLAGLGSIISALLASFKLRRSKSGNYTFQGQAAAVGPNARADDFQPRRSQSDLDFSRLAQELAQLRSGMKQEAQGTAEQDEAIGAVAAAEKAADQGDGPTVLRHLATAGRWSLGVAEKIGVAVAAEAIKRAM